MTDLIKDAPEIKVIEKHLKAIAKEMCGDKGDIPEAIFEYVLDKQLFGFLLECWRRVYDENGVSDGRYDATWFYGETFDQAHTKLLKWAEAQSEKEWKAREKAMEMETHATDSDWEIETKWKPALAELVRVQEIDAKNVGVADWLGYRAAYKAAWDAARKALARLSEAL